jgi:4,5-dihydroxyphthalate decarboxylase
MPKISLTLAMNPYDRVLPLVHGEVPIEGVEIDYVGFPGGVDVFYDQLKFDRYDVSEMSVSSFFKARQQGWAYRMLPVLHNRNYYYTQIVVRKSSGIRQDHPEDLIGKRVGVADYQQSAALWTRGILQHDFNVQPSDLIWYMERGERFSHGGASKFYPPSGVEFHYAAADLYTLFERGELDAAVTYLSGSSMDRPKPSLLGNPDYMLLFADPEAEGLRYFRTHGVYPPQHTTVIRESIVQEHPWLARVLVQAFERSKKIALERVYRQAPSLIAFASAALARQRAVMGDDPYPYGLRNNARAIDMIQTFSAEQGLTPRKQAWNEIFPEEVLVMEDVGSAEEILAAQNGRVAVA